MVGRRLFYQRFPWFPCQHLSGQSQLTLGLHKHRQRNTHYPSTTIISSYIHHHLQKVLISATRLENDFFNLTTVNLLLQLLNVRLLRRESVRVLAASAAMGQLDNQSNCQQRHVCGRLDNWQTQSRRAHRFHVVQPVVDQLFGVLPVGCVLGHGLQRAQDL